MKEITDIIFETSFDELAETLKKIPYDETVGLVVLLNQVKYEFLINIKFDNEDLICLGPSGLPNMEMIDKFKSKPVFTRHSWDFNESTLYYNDNTRYVWDGAVGSGWGMGLPDDYFLENIKDIILEITNFFKIKNDNIIFYGSSMGGFTSIQLATMIKDSYAIAENPQIDARNWIKSYYIKNGLYSPLYSPEVLNSFEPYTYNIIEMIKKEKYVPNLTLVHDISDEDIQNHLIPFINELKHLPFGEKDDFNKIHIMMEPMPKHEPIPKDKLYDLFESHRCYRHKSGNKIDYDLIAYGIMIIKELNLFDADFYTANYPDIEDYDPLTHYIFQGWKEGKNPSAVFDNDFYLTKYPSVKRAGFNPLIHYAVRGINENRMINPYDQIRSMVRLLEKSDLFDKEYYNANYNNYLYDLKPIQHYLIKGWKEGNNPSKKFDTKFYLMKYPDVRESGMNPLVHYLNHGIYEKRIIKEVDD